MRELSSLRDLTQSELGESPSYSTDPTRADYACPLYRQMRPRWEMVDDVRAGTPRLRAKSSTYIPRFEAEVDRDWMARVDMTFAEDHYARTVVDHVGLVLAKEVEVRDDVPEQLAALMEDVDGEGSHLDVFAQATLDAALHYGHSVLLTDYPEPVSAEPLSWTPPPGYSRTETLATAGAARKRPYVTLYPATDVLTWRTATIGGVSVIVQIMFRERSVEPDGDYGVTSAERFRELKQDVMVNADGRAIALGPITWRTFTKPDRDSAPVEDDKGVIVGPRQIPVRVVYGGERLGTLYTKPHLFGLALKSLEEVQVQSDYAAIMHKCNVPTPVFVGRPQTGPGTGETVNMAYGLDIPIGGNAFYMEPSGAALEATRLRLQDIQAAVERQGAASSNIGSGRSITATEASLLAKQRDAKLVRAGRSLQDALEGMLADMAAFLALPDGGSLKIDTDPSQITLDPAYLDVLFRATEAGILPSDAFLAALKTGKLPDDFDAMEEALRMIAAGVADADGAEEAVA
jgi:hypothetical protein